jgi:O-antigen/teichoic acid export membrane protein
MSAGLNPINRNTLAALGSAAKAFALSTASLLTGLVNNLVFLEAADFNTASALLTTTVAAATPTPSINGVQNFDGSIIVPPGGVLALLNTVSSTTHSVAARLMWEEVPA